MKNNYINEWDLVADLVNTEGKYDKEVRMGNKKVDVEKFKIWAVEKFKARISDMRDINEHFTYPY